MAKKIHRFIGDFDLQKETIFITDKELVNQMNIVLKLSIGEIICLCNGFGNEADAQIEKIEKNKIEVKILTHFQNTKEPEDEAYIFLAILKNENFDLVVQKASEIGIKKIIPILTTHTVKQNINKERLQKIAKEAAELSGRASVPEICPIMKFNNALLYAKEIAESVFFFDSAGAHISSVVIKGKKRAFFIGPEGGWGDEERIFASDEGIPFVSLGNLTFRGETAAIIGSYFIIYGNR